jgi:molybdopterin/thiamine biosynthesis adenylyltransferase
MARAGIGTITAADGDVFDQSNLNRQLFAREDNLRQSKAQAAQTRLRQINTSVDFQVWNVFLQVEDYTDFLENQNLVVDALGGLDVRRDLLHQAAIMGVPLVTGAVAGEMGYVSTVYPGENGPLELWQGQSGAEESLGCLDYGVSLVASLQCAEVIHILAGRAASLRGRLLVCDLKDFSWQVFDL